MSTKSNLSLNALRVFDVAARAGTFKQAAQQLGVTQAAVTRQIQTLENQLGMRLFQRDNRVHALTPAGLELAPALESIFRELDHTIQRARSTADHNITRLTLAISSERLRYWLQDRLADFHSIYPHIQLSFVRSDEQVNDAQQADWASQIQHENIDLLISQSLLRDTQIQQTTLYKPSYVAISPDANCDSTQATWFVDKAHPMHQQVIEQHTSRTHPLTINQCADTTMALDLALTYQGVAIVDEQLTQHPSLSDWHTLGKTESSRSVAVYAQYRKKRRYSVALVALLNWLKLQVKDIDAS